MSRIYLTFMVNNSLIEDTVDCNITEVELVD